MVREKATFVPAHILLVIEAIVAPGAGVAHIVVKFTPEVQTLLSVALQEVRTYTEYAVALASVVGLIVVLDVVPEKASPVGPLPAAPEVRISQLYAVGGP